MIIKSACRIITNLFAVGVLAQACVPAGTSQDGEAVGEAAQALSPYKTFQIVQADGTARTVNIPDADIAASLAATTKPFVAGGVTTTNIKALLTATNSVVGTSGTTAVARSGRVLTATPKPGLTRRVSWNEAMTQVELRTGTSTSSLKIDATIASADRAMLLGQVSRAWLEGFSTASSEQDPNVVVSAWVPQVIGVAILAQVSCCTLSTMVCAFSCGAHGMRSNDCDSNLSVGSDGSFELGLGCDSRCECNNPYGGDSGGRGGAAEVITSQ